MSQPDELTRAATAALAFEVAVLLAGVGLILWLLWSPRGRGWARTPLAEWRLPAIDFACYACFAFVGFAALSGVAGLLLRHFHLDDDATKVAQGAVQDVGLLLGIAAFHLAYRARAGGDGAPPERLATLRSGAATFLVVMPLVIASSNAWEYVLNLLGLPDEKQDIVDVLQNTHSAALKCALVAVAVLLAPAAEEIVFRGGLFRYFRTRIPRWAAIGLTSALFGALHVSWWGANLGGLPALVPMIVLAAVFCLAYERTGKIGTVIVAHALFNLNTLVLVIAGMGS